MELSNSLAKEFASVTNDKKVRATETTVYGVVSKKQDGTFIKIDGADVLTPATSIVSVVDGERVVATIKNHTATITGSNEETPVANTKDLQHVSETYDAALGQVVLNINTLTKFTNDLKTGNGETIIDGGCINAVNLNLSGCITFNTFANEVAGVANGAATAAGNALGAANDNADAIKAINNRTEKIHSTYISATEIKSPEITGNSIKSYGGFKALDADDNVCGYFGSAYGMDGSGTQTTGVAIVASDTGSIDGTDHTITIDSDGNYVIATNAGVRTQSGSNSITATSDDVRITVNSRAFMVDNDGLYYNGIQICDTKGLITSNVVATFG